MKAIRTIMATLVVVLALARLAYLDADFPPHMDKSGDLLTDEGWKCCAAARWCLSGDWYADGDNNPAVSLPVMPLMQTINFTLFGANLLSARAFSVAVFFMLLMVMYLLLRRVSGANAALIGSLLLAGNFFLFAFSRLAFLEIPMMCFVAISFLLLEPRGTAEWRRIKAVLAGVCFALAVLTKTTAIAFFPPLLYLCVSNLGSRKEMLLNLMAMLIPTGAIFMADYVLNILPHFDAFRFYMEANTIKKAQKSLGGGITSFFENAWMLVRISPLLVATMVGCLVLSLKNWRLLLKHRMLIALAISLLLYLGMLSIVTYHPSRYFVPAIVIVAVITGILADRADRASVAVMLAVLVCLAGGIVRIENYFLNREYTFIAMCCEVGQAARADAGKDALLLGDWASTAALAAGLPFVDDKFAPSNLDWRLERYRPTHYLCLGAIDPNVRQTLEQRYVIEHRGTYNILGNYYRNLPMEFYHLITRPSVATDESRR